MSLMMGMFDASTGVPYVLLQLHNHFGWTLRTLCLVFAILPALFCPINWFLLLPSNEEERASMAKISAATGDVNTASSSSSTSAADMPLFPVPDEGSLTKTVLQKTWPVMKQQPFILMVLFYCICLPQV